jgi:hypothetical protein
MMGHMYLTVAVLAFVLVCASIWSHLIARRDWIEEQRDVALRRELSRFRHPSEFEVDWTPPHGTERPDV